MLRSQLCRLSDGAIHGLAFEQGHGQGWCMLGSVDVSELLDNLYLGAALMSFADPTAVQPALTVENIYRVFFAKAQHAAKIVRTFGIELQKIAGTVRTGKEKSI